MFYKTVAHCITNQQQVKSVTRTNWMAKLFLLLLLSLLGGGDKMSQCVCVCACVFVCVWVSLCVWVVNACTCAWRARRRQPSPEGGIYLKRASHDLAWSRRFILRWGCMCVHVCVCVSACARVHAQRWGICGSFQRPFPPEDRTALLPTARSANLTDSLVQLSAKKQPTSKVQVPAEESYLPWDDRGEAALPELFPGKRWRACLTLRLFVCLLVVCQRYTVKTFTFSGLSWMWQFDRLSERRSKRQCTDTVTLVFCRHFERTPLNFCPLTLHFCFQTLLCYTTLYTIVCEHIRMHFFALF